MKQKINQSCKWLITRLLTLLGFSSSLAFMACYGVPTTDDPMLPFDEEDSLFVPDAGAIPADAATIPADAGLIPADAAQLPTAATTDAADD